MKPQLREDGRLVLSIKTEKDLRTYMQPLRQKILFQLNLHPEGMTAKQLADTLHIAPSSAGHHLGKLEESGLVELAYTQQIHGITAKFYRSADVTVSIGVIEGAVQMHQALVQNAVAEQMSRLMDMMSLRERGLIGPDALNSQLSNGVLYLTPAQAEEFQTMLGDFFNRHAVWREGTQAFEYVFIATNLTLWQQNRDKLAAGAQSPAPEDGAE